MIRPARDTDLSELPRIELSAAQKFVGQDVPRFLLEHVEPGEVYRPHLEAGTLWVYEAAGEAVAFLAARVAGERLHVDELDVRQDQQGKGLGRQLLGHAATWARAHGLTCMSLTTFRNIPWNAPFYGRIGFQEWDAAEAPPDIQRALRMEAAKGLTDRCAMRLAL